MKTYGIEGQALRQKCRIFLSDGRIIACNADWTDDVMHLDGHGNQFIYVVGSFGGSDDRGHLINIKHIVSVESRVENEQSSF